MCVSCDSMHISIYYMSLCNGHWLGPREVIDELENMFINGKYTPFSETPPSKKHPLIETTNEEKPAKKRKVQSAPSRSLNDFAFTQ